jgi:tetratricopeptide (TPR) repeat protein
MKRFLIPAIALLVAPWLIHRLCYVPYRCNKEIGVGIYLTENNQPRSDIDMAITARSLVKRMQGCLTSQRELVGAYMVAAANLRVINRPNEALDLYRRASSLDRRPELYLQMGNTLSEMGNRNEAIRYYRVAVAFNPQYIYDRSLLPPAVWDEVYRRFVEDEQRFRGHKASYPWMPIE